MIFSQKWCSTLLPVLLIALFTHAFSVIAEDTELSMTEPDQVIGNRNWVTDTSDRKIVFHPNGKTVFMPMGESLQQMDTSTGVPVKTFPFIAYYHLFVLPESNLVIGFNTRTIAKLDLTTGKLVTADSKKLQLKSGVISPDESYLVTYDINTKNEKHLRRWNISDLKPVKGSEVDMDRSTPGFYTYAFHPDGKLLYAAGRSTRDYHKPGIYTVDMNTNKLSMLPAPKLGKYEQDVLLENAHTYTAIFLINDNTQILGFDSNSRVMIFDATTGAHVKTLLKSNGYPYHPSISKDGKKAVFNLRFRSTSSTYHGLMTSGKKIPLPKAGKPFKVEGVLNILGVIDLDEKFSKQPVTHILNRHTGMLAMAPDGSYFLHQSERSTQVDKIMLDTGSKGEYGNEKKGPSVKKPIVHAAAISPTSFITYEDSGHVKLWTESKGEFRIKSELDLKAFTNQSTIVSSAVFGNGRYLLMSDSFNKNIYLIDLRRFRLLTTLNDMRFNPVREIIAPAKSTRGIYARCGAELVPLTLRGSKVSIGKSIKLGKAVPKLLTPLLQDNRAAIHTGKEIQIIDTQKGKSLKTLQLKAPGNNDTTFNQRYVKDLNRFPKNPWLAILYPGGVDIVDISTEKILHRFPMQLASELKRGSKTQAKYYYTDIYPVNEDHFIVTDNRGKWELWNITEQKVIQVGQGHTNQIESITLLDKTTIISHSRDTTAALWTLMLSGAPLPKLTDAQVTELWENFADPATKNKARAYFTQNASEHLTLWTRLMQPVKIDKKKINTLIEALKSQQADTRSKAQQELKNFDMLALPFLKETAETTDDLATREACLALADEIAANAGNQPYIHKHLIVINALNPSKNAREKGILLKLSKGHPDSVITQAAKNALNND